MPSHVNAYVITLYQKFRTGELQKGAFQASSRKAQTETKEQKLTCFRVQGSVAHVI